MNTPHSGKPQSKVLIHPGQIDYIKAVLDNHAVAIRDLQGQIGVLDSRYQALRREFVDYQKRTADLHNMGAERFRVGLYVSAGSAALSLAVLAWTIFK